MTVGDLKEMCEDILYTLDNYDDDLKIRLSANTYGIGNDFIASYEGFLPISQIEDRIETGDDDEISDSVRRVKDSEGNWTLWLYDVWGNDEDGYEVNDRREVARGLNIKDTVTDDIILDILKLYKVVERSTTLNDISIGYDENAVYVDDANGKPLCEIVNDDYDY